MTLPRGFKAEAEREAVRIRNDLGLPPNALVKPEDLAAYADASLISAERLVPRESLEELERIQAYAFSAATFEISGRVVIVTNPLRTPERRASDISHEVAHLRLKHQLTEVREIDGVPFRTCKPDEEEQATAFGGTLLLPRPLLLSAAKRGWGPTEIAHEYGVTFEMARFRFNTTGVGRQANYMRR